MVGLWSLNVCAKDDLTHRLQQIDDSVKQDIRVFLLETAERNHLLDDMALNQAAVVAADAQHWTLAGFYFLAAAMRQKVDGRVYDLITPQPIAEVIEGDSRQETFPYLTYVLFKNPVFKKVMDHHDKALKFTEVNQQIKLYLLQHQDVLSDSLSLYAMWRPAFSEQYIRPLTSLRRLSIDEANQAFVVLNQGYMTFFRDLLVLMAIPEYQDLKIKKQLAFMDWSVDILEQGVDGMGKQHLIQMNRWQHGIDRIELVQGIYPELDWGWFR